MKKNYLKFSDSGMSLILPVLLVGFVGISVFLTLAASVIISLGNVVSDSDANLAKRGLSACLNEYLVHLPSNNGFAPGTITTPDSSCTVTVTEPVANQKQAVFVNTVGDITRQLTVEVNVSTDPITVLEISEP